MKTIEEVAIEYSDNLPYTHSKTLTGIISFKGGVEFAQRWIPVEEELPEEKNHRFSDLVLTKDSFGNIKLERYDFEFMRFNQIRYDSLVKDDGQVSHWRPINIE